MSPIETGPPAGADSLHAFIRTVDAATRIDDAFTAALTAVRDALGVDRAALLLLDDDGQMRFRAWEGLSRAYRTAVEGHSPWAPDDPSPEMIYVPDVTTDRALAGHREVFAREDIRALVFLPLVTREGLRGKFMLYASRPHPWDAPGLDHALHVTHHVGFVFDRIGMEERLRTSLARLEVLARHVPQGILFEDESGVIAGVNRRFSEIFGLPAPDELVGEDCMDVAASILPVFRDPDGFVATVTRLKERRTPDSGIEVALADGRILECAYVPVEEEGALDGSLWTYEDVTRRRWLEKRLAAMRTRKRLGDLAGGIAHDFNNMLTAVSGYAELLGARHDDTETRALLDELHAVTRQASELTHTLLTHSRSPSGRPERLVLEPFLRDTIAPYQRLLEPEITVRIESGAPDAAVSAVRSRLLQVVQNLLVNGRDAMPGGGDLIVRLLPCRPPGPGITTIPATGGARRWCAIEVRDTGCGMDEATRASVFEPDFTTKAGIRGFGLATAWDIVQDLGGDIEVESAPGQGSTFRVLLPLVDTADDDAGGGDAPDPDGRRLDPDDDTSGDGPRLTVLLVDDDTSVRRTLSTAISLQGYHVLDAPDGRAALDLLLHRDGAVDALVTDVRMPNMDGPTLVDEVRRRGWTMPIVMITGYSHHARPNDPDVVLLPKPFRPRELLALLPQRR